MSRQQHPNLNQPSSSRRDSAWAWNDSKSAEEDEDRQMRQVMADKWRLDMSNWFPDTKDKTQSDDESTWAHTSGEIKVAVNKLRLEGWGRGHTHYPGSGYMPGTLPRQRAEVQAQLENAVVNWDGPATRRILPVGPRDELALEHEGLTIAEAAAKYPGEKVEVGGGEMTIVAAAKRKAGKRRAGEPPGSGGEAQPTWDFSALNERPSKRSRT